MEQNFIYHHPTVLFRRRRRRFAGDFDVSKLSNEETGFDLYYSKTSNIVSNDEQTENDRRAAGPNNKEPQTQFRLAGRDVQRSFISRENQEQEIRNPNKFIEYTDVFGNKYIKRGGSLAWRTNNPGALSVSSLEVAKQYGAIGVYDDGDGHKFCIFKTEADGEKAMRKLLQKRSSSYYRDGSKKTIAEMIRGTYAPPTENDSRAYANFIQDRTGIDVYKKSIEDLSNREFNSVVEAIKDREMRIEGEIIANGYV